MNARVMGGVICFRAQPLGVCLVKRKRLFVHTAMISLCKAWRLLRCVAVLIQANPQGLIVCCMSARSAAILSSLSASRIERASERRGNVVSVCPACPPADSPACLLHHANATMD